MKKIFLTLALGSLCACTTNAIKNQLNTIGKPGEIEITAMKKVRDPNTGTITVYWNFNATNDKPEQVYWRCDYFDANGIRVGEEERYVEATIYPEQPTLAKCSYPSQQVVDFKISIQNIATNMIVYH